MPTVSCIVLICGKVCGVEGLLSMIYQLRDQTYKEIEILPVACCTDNLQAVEHLTGIKTDVVHHSGSYEKCNRGLELATGEYIGFFAGDDLYEHTYLEKMMANRRDLLYCDFHSHYRQDGSVCPGALEMGHLTTGSFLIRTELAKRYRFPITGMGDIEYIQEILHNNPNITTEHIPEALYIHR